MTSLSFGQQKSMPEILQTLDDVKNEKNGNFDSKKLNKNSSIIFIEGTNAIFSEIYLKFGGKKLKENVFIVGGWKNVMTNMKPKKKFEHLKDIFKDIKCTAYIDLNSESLKSLSLEKFSIVRLNNKENKFKIKSFGSDRISFLKEIKKYFN